MKKLSVLPALVLAGLAAVSLATAKPPPGRGSPHGRPADSASSCHPNVAVILKGTFGAASGDSFTMAVTRANAHGQKLLGPQTIATDAKTRFVRRGHAGLADFVAGDRLNVQARTCLKKKGGTPAAGPIVAKRVVGQPVTGSGSGSDSGTQAP